MFLVKQIINDYENSLKRNNEFDYQKSRFYLRFFYRLCDRRKNQSKRKQIFYELHFLVKQIFNHYEKNVKRKNKFDYQNSRLFYGFNFIGYAIDVKISLSVKNDFYELHFSSKIDIQSLREKFKA